MRAIRIAITLEALENLQSAMERLVDENSSALANVHPENRASATNLLHYLGPASPRCSRTAKAAHRVGALFFGTDGVAGLERRANGHARAFRIATSQSANGAGGGPESDRDEGQRLLERNTNLLLGPEPQGRKVRIMVTMPSEAATDFELVRELLGSGMDVMRINCAHDGPEAWSGMIRNLRRAEKETGRSCKIEMDVAGPKLRTGPLAPGPAVVKFRPIRDAFGRVEKPARVWLTPIDRPEAPPSNADACIPVPGRWLDQLGPGHRVRFTDTRGSRRRLTITERAGGGVWAESTRTAYVAPGVILTAHKKKPKRRLRARVGPLPALQQPLLLRAGDTLILTHSLEPGRSAEFNAAQEVVRPAQIGVTLAEFFESVQPGQPIWLDDGKIGGRIVEVGPERVSVKIMQAKASGAKLGAEKGINLPETELKTPSLTPADVEALNFIAQHADILGYSFVRTEEDVRLLQSHLHAADAGKLGIVLKIETKEGFDNLPSLLLTASSSRSVGVMIARGDLAIECGYERLAEAQEEILWISEAAHVPVIWATQVLESLAKTGTPSRSEITDAAMGERAECVMLNKGPYVIEAVRTLDDILRRMQAHQNKKRSMMRRLSVATGFEGDAATP